MSFRPRSMLSSLWRTLYWLAFNAASACLLYLAEFEHADGAKNLLVFLVWLMLMFAAVGATDEVAKDADIASSVRSNPIPVRLDVAFDSLFLCALIWFGWWLTGIAWLAHMLCMQTMRMKVAKLAEAT